ncbi:hypothetical protein KR100_01280 [Synechococcus sp. KORDI-100]|nr:hypothetical protein KR100_01280 [Synechococcus sp. KORDI-100]
MADLHRIITLDDIGEAGIKSMWEFQAGVAEAIAQKMVDVLKLDLGSTGGAPSPDGH